MLQKQLIGLIGSTILFIGVFCPTLNEYHVTTQRSEAANIFFSNGNRFSDLVLPLAIAAFVLILKKQYKWQLYTGAASLALILYSLIMEIRFVRSMNDSYKSMYSMGYRGSSDSVYQLQFGWGLLIVGAGIIITSAILKGEMGISNTKPLHIKKTEDKFQADQPTVHNDFDVSDSIECPMCAEIIKSKAIKCRYCGHIIRN